MVEQLSGDLLTDATLDQRVATGFCRAHVTTNEGDSIEQEVFTRNVVDRVSTMGTVFLGLTLGCAVCHDHKFDPITQQEFYQLFAFFNSLDGPALDGNVKDPAPVVSVPSQAQTAALQKLREQIAAIRAQRAARQATTDPKFAPWLRQRVQRAQLAVADDELTFLEGLIVHCRFDIPMGNLAENPVENTAGQQVRNDADPSHQGRLVGTVDRVEGRMGGGIELGKQGHVDLGNVGNFNDDVPFSYGAWVKTSNGRNSIVLA